MRYARTTGCAQGPQRLQREVGARTGRTGSPPNYSYQSTIDYTYGAGNPMHIATDIAHRASEV